MTGVNLQFKRFSMRPPPFVDLVLDAGLENAETIPMWFLLPLYLDPNSGFGPFQASAVEIFELPGSGLVRIARFLGAGSFQALRLPAGAKVRIHDLSITLVGVRPRGDITIPANLAEQLTIGGSPAEQWFKVDVTSALLADVTLEPGAIVASQETPGAKAVPVTGSGVRMLTIPVKVN